MGFKVRDKRKGRDRNETTYTTSSTLKLANYLETGFDLPPYLDGRYDLTPYTSQSAVADILSQATFTGVVNHARDAENFDGTERTVAGYAMAEIYAGPKLFLLPGVRYEYTTRRLPRPQRPVRARTAPGSAAIRSSRRRITACRCRPSMCATPRRRTRTCGSR